jgi:LysM repeat protein
MIFRGGFFRWVLVLACVGLSACAPSGSKPLDEEKEPHFLAGKSRVMARDYNGAIECFEKALQVNPQSSAAHFELAYLYENKEVDPAAAIYHYKHYLQLRPHAENADLTKQRIANCKQALAESVSLGPVTDRIQREVEKTAEENKRLTEDNKQLKEELAKWSAYASRLETMTNSAAIQHASPLRATVVRNEEPALRATHPATAAAVATMPMAGAATAQRTHTIRAGETPTQIAKRYGVKLEALLAANPGVNAHRLKVGQTLRIPGS